MGMTDNQYKSVRREHLDDYEELLEYAKEANVDSPRFFVKLEKMIAKAKADVESL